MFNHKIYEWASEIVSRGDVTDLTNRVYRQIVAEAKLNRLAKEESRRTKRAVGRRGTAGNIDANPIQAYKRYKNGVRKPRRR